MEHSEPVRSPNESRPVCPPQEQSIKVLELLSTIWDTELHIAGLRLLNNLPLPDYVHPQLRRVMPALMEIMQADYVLAQVPARQGRGSAPTGPGAAARGKSGGSRRSAEAQTHLPSPAVPYPGTSCPPTELPGTEERPSLRHSQLSGEERWREGPTGCRDASGGFREGWVHETGFFNVLVCLRIACAVSVAASRGRQISAHKPPRGCCHHVTPILVPLREQGALLTAESSVFSPASHTVLSSTSGHRSCPCPLTMTQCLCKAVKRAQRPAETRRAGRSWPAPSPRPPRPQVHSNFLSLFQSSQPGSLLFEVLVFAERLSEGRNSTHYRAVKWHYNEQSLHEALFGDESRLADRLLSLVIHPEEEVQIQACKVIVSLQCPQDVSCRPSGCRPLPCRPSQSYFQNGE